MSRSVTSDHHFVDFHVTALGVVLLAVVIQGCFYAYSVANRIPREADISSGACLFLVSIFTYAFNRRFMPRQTVSTLILSAWGIRLAVFNFRHRSRVFGGGTFASYPRFASADAGYVFSRTAWTLLAMLPTISINTTEYEMTPFNLDECVGSTAAVAFIYLEALADAQKQSYYSESHAKGDTRATCCTRGVWAWSRHANHFFNIAIQWALFVVVREAVMQHHPHAILGPIMNTVFLVGLPGGILHNERERGIR